MAATFGSGRSSRAIASPTSSRACSPESALKIGRISAASIGCCSRRAWPSASRRKWTVQRCQGDPLLQALVRVGDDQLHTAQAALDQAAEELPPERFGLALAAIEPDHLAAAGLMDAMRDHQTLPDDAATVSDLLDR